MNLASLQYKKKTPPKLYRQTDFSHDTVSEELSLNSFTGQILFS